MTNSDGWLPNDRVYSKPALPDDYFRKPSPARLWNYLQGGKDNYQLDRDAGDQMAARYPAVFDMARQARFFLMRGVRYLAADAGLRQLLDIGCGLPAPHPLRNTHDIAQDIVPDSRVVYADNDKVVLAHARALLTSRTDAGRTAYIDSDVRDTEYLLTEAAKTLDFDEPIAVLMLGVLGAINFDEALAVVSTITAAVASGSYLLHEDGVALSPERRAAVSDRNETGMNTYQLRSPDELRKLYTGWELIEPGLVSVAHWRPELISADRPPAEEYGALARKP